MDSFRFKVRLTWFITALAFLGVIVRLWHVSHNRLVDPVLATHPTPQLRGSILDRNGSYLALTVSSASIFLRPARFQDQSKTIAALSRVTGLSRTEIDARIKRGSPSFVWLMRQVSQKTGNAVRALELPGVEVTSEPRRVYPHGGLAAHLIGFSGIDNVGLTGVEKGWDKALLPRKDPNDPVLNVVLTIDRYIQYIAEEELQMARTNLKATRALCLVYQPRSGEILAMAASPSFDLNHFTSYRQQDFINPLVSRPYEPGSTFKIFTAAFLLKNRMVSYKTLFYCPGKVKIYDHTVSCLRPHGNLNLADIIKYSCNVGTIKLSRRIGRRPFYRFLRSLGFGRPTGIGLPGESGGILRPPDKWSGLSRSMVSIGYEISVTPLQLVRAVGCLATGGLLMRPHIVRAVSDWRGRLVRTASPRAERRVFSQETARDVARMLRRAVQDYGTGRAADLPGYQVGGKTGTANIARADGKGYYEDRYNASFVGLIPYLKSRLVILVVIRQPRMAHTGGMAAAPVFRRIAGRVLRYLEKKQGQ